MKTFFCVGLAMVLPLAAASAKPNFRFETVVTDSDAPGEGILGRAHIVSKAGAPTTIRVGEFEYTISATLQRDGSIRLTEGVVHHYSNGKTHAFGPYQRTLPSGETTDLALGGIFFSTTPTVE